jgi:hypothetical protein
MSVSILILSPRTAMDLPNPSASSRISEIGFGLQGVFKPTVKTVFFTSPTKAT